VKIVTRELVQPFDPDDGGLDYLFVKVADHIEARIETGELRPGARLPGERDLAAEYHVSIGTMRRAIGVLRRRGLIVVLPARGTYVANSALN
jgi:DNA-binding GntR family transcriptional regulator